MTVASDELKDFLIYNLTQAFLKAEDLLPGDSDKVMHLAYKDAYKTVLIEIERLEALKK